MKLHHLLPIFLLCLLLLTLTVSAAGEDAVTIPLLREGALTDVHFDPNRAEHLTERERCAEEAILTAVEAGLEKADLRRAGYTDAEELTAFLTELMNTDIMYSALESEVTFFSDNGTITEIGLKYREEASPASATGITTVEQGIQHALACVDDSMSDLEKALNLHDYLVREIDYDLRLYSGTMPDASYHPEGLFINRLAVCQGYAEAYSALMKRCGIESYVISSGLMNHAWNLIRIDGYWYHVDCTWDDPLPADGQDISSYARSGHVGHHNFLRSDEEFRQLCGHDGWSSGVPKAVKSGAYVGYCFRPTADGDVPMLNKIGNYYYYLGVDSTDRTIIRSTFQGTEYTVLETGEPLTYLFTQGGKLYASTSHYVYEIGLDGKPVRCILGVEYELMNFWLKLDELACYEKKPDGTVVRRTVDLTASAELLKKDGLTFLILENGEAVVTEAELDTDISVIPGSIRGHQVVGIAARVFMYYGSLEELIIEKGIRNIGESAFWNSGVSRLILPESLNRLEDEAFLYCYNLADVYFAGDVPANWGNAVFSSEKSSDILLHYAAGRKGWTYPEWKDPRGCVYQTYEFLPEVLTRADACGDRAFSWCQPKNHRQCRWRA